MNVSLYIARRLGMNAGSSRHTSPGLIAGYIGVALAITIMLMSLFIVHGFKKEIKEKLLGFNAPINIHAPENDVTPAFTSGIRLTDSLRSLITSTVESAVPTISISQPAIFKTDTDFQGVVLKGIDPAKWHFYKDNLIEGSIPTAETGDNCVVISKKTASLLRLNVGDRLTTHFLDDNNIRSRKLTITGIFESHFSDFDNTFAATPIGMLQKLNKVDSITGTIIEVGPVDFDLIPQKVSELNNELITNAILHSEPTIPRTSTIYDMCGRYFSWLDLLDTNVIVIIILMACVSGFTLISSMFIIILEHVNTIGLLKALGATNHQIRRIFIYMAQRLVLKGMLIGNLIAIALAYAQTKWQLIPLDPDSYYLNNVPIDFSWTTIVIVDLSAIVVAVLVLILPSHLIARLSPATSLRYE